MRVQETNSNPPTRWRPSASAQTADASLGQLRLGYEGPHDPHR